MTSQPATKDAQLSTPETPEILWAGPGADDPLPDLIRPSTDWERTLNSWCHGRVILNRFNGVSQAPADIVRAALWALGPPIAAARLGHHMEWDPVYQSRKTSDSPWICTSRQWTCCACLARLTIPRRDEAGRLDPALTAPCRRPDRKGAR